MSHTKLGDGITYFSHHWVFIVTMNKAVLLFFSLFCFCGSLRLMTMNFLSYKTILMYRDRKEGKEKAKYRQQRTRTYMCTLESQSNLYLGIVLLSLTSQSGKDKLKLFHPHTGMDLAVVLHQHVVVVIDKLILQ